MADDGDLLDDELLAAVENEEPKVDVAGGSVRSRSRAGGRKWIVEMTPHGDDVASDRGVREELLTHA